MNLIPSRSWRNLRFALPLVASLAAQAQIAPTPPADTTAAGGEIVQMSLFEVKTTQNRGYVVDNSANGFKTSESLMNIPQAIVVVTRDMIDDTATYNPTDTLRYAGVATQFSGAAFNLRGTRAIPLVDGMSGDPSADPVNIDSYQLIKGPAAVFYHSAGLGGTVLETTRKPQSAPLASANGGVNSFGLYRFEVDATGPIGMIGAAKFNYRIDAAYQDGGMYFTYMTDKRTIIDPSFGIEYKSTSIYFAYNFEAWSHIGGPGNEAAFANYDGSLFRPGGDLKRAAFLVPNSAEKFQLNTIRAGLTQRFGDNWELQMQFQQHRYVRGPSVVEFTDDVNFVNRTFNVFFRDNDLRNIYDFLQADVTGRYNIGPFPAQSTFGMGYQANESINRLDSRLLPAGWPASNRGPIDNPGPYLDSTVLPSIAQYNALPNTEHQYSESQSYTTNLYYQESVDVVPKWVSLVGGLGYLTSTTYRTSDIALINKPTTITKTSPPLLHRYGAVVHLTREVSLYGLYSETAQGATQVSLSNQIFPGTQGKGKEVGVKTDLNNGGISITAAVYDIRVTNQLVYTGIIDPATGAYVYRNIGSTGTKGFEVDAAVRVTPQWQVMAHYDNSPVKDYFGNQVAGTDQGVTSFFTRFDITHDIAIGGGYSLTRNEIVSTAGITFLPNQTASIINVKEGNQVALFAEWHFAKHWSVRVGVDNLLDAIYPQGINAIVQLDPSPPRSENVRLAYKW